MMKLRHSSKQSKPDEKTTNPGGGGVRIMHDIQQPGSATAVPVAAIHLGAKSVTLLVGEREGDGGADGGTVRRIDFLEKPVPLALDIFRDSRISPESIDLCVDALTTCLKSLKEYGFDLRKNPPRIVVTNLLGDAASQEAFLNRIHMACGITIEPLDDGEMTRLVFVRAMHLFSKQQTLAKKKVLVIHIGPGNTRVLFFRKGRIAAYASYRLGAIRVRAAIKQPGLTQESIRSMTRGQIRGHVEQIVFDFADFGVEQIVMIGTEVQAAAPFVAGKDKPVCQLSLRKFESFLSSLEKETTDGIVRRLEVDYLTAESMVPALHTNLSVAQKFGLNSFTTMGGNFEEGLLFDLLSSSSAMTNFQQEVMQSAIQLARKFQTDLKHGSHVETLSMTLFESLRDIHKLDTHDALILRVASILHECGSFVSRKAHHHHSYYLIKNSDIFGLSELDTRLAALIARYHRHSPPRDSHEEYHDLPREERMRVSKLAAILRVADALEKGHDQRVRDIQVEIKKRTLRIHCLGTQDVRIEQIALDAKGDLFRLIYGMDIVLVPDKG